MAVTVDVITRPALVGGANVASYADRGEVDIIARESTGTADVRSYGPPRGPWPLIQGGGGPVAYFATVSETATLSDGIGTTRRAYPTVAEAVTAGEALATQRAARPSPSETVVLSEVLASSRLAVVSIAETGTLSEAVAIHRLAVVSIADAPALAESLAASKRWLAPVSETTTLSESLVAVYAPAPVAIPRAPGVSLLAPLLVTTRSIHQIATSRAILTGSILMSSYVYGTRVRLTGEFRDVSNDLFDPDEPQFDIEYPSEVKAGVNRVGRYTYPDDAEIVRDSVGLYHVDVLLSVVGGWRYTWRSMTPGSEVIVSGRLSVVADIAP